MEPVSSKRTSQLLGIGVAAAAVAALAGVLRKTPVSSSPLPKGRRSFSTAVAEDEPLGTVAALRAAVKRDNLPLLAAGLAFYGLIALLPAVIATISVYGLVADVGSAEQLVKDVAGALPPEAQQLVADQVARVAGAPSAGLSIGLVVSLAAVLWTVSTAVQALIKAVNQAYGVSETRSAAGLRLISFGLALGSVVVVVAMAALVTVGPSIAEWLGWSSEVDWVISVVRWPALALVVTAGLALLYRWAPNRPPPERWWATRGSAVAMLMWLVASAGLSIYVETFGRSSYVATYGALAGVVILMLWLFMGGLAVLIGAELNALLSRQKRE
jgi:membrane protein